MCRGHPVAVRGPRRTRAYRYLGDKHAANVATGLPWAGLGLVAGLSALVVGRRRSDGREHWLIAAGTLGSAIAVFPVAGSLIGGLLVGRSLPLTFAVAAAAALLAAAVISAGFKRTGNLF